MNGEVIRKLRSDRGWTQLDLARHFGCSDRKIKGWESGQYEPSASEMRDLKNLLAGADLELEPAGAK